MAVRYVVISNKHLLELSWHIRSALELHIKADCMHSISLQCCIWNGIGFLNLMREAYFVQHILVLS